MQQRDMLQRTSKAVSTVIVLLIATSLGVAGGCARTGERAAQYVATRSEQAQKFLGDVGVLSKDSGLSPQLRSAIHSPGNVQYVLEAKGRGLRLWLQNMPLSGQEDPILCGPSGGPRPDPAQFIFYVEPRYPWISQERAEAMQAHIVESLRRLGYDVKAKPLPCGNAILIPAIAGDEIAE